MKYYSTVTKTLYDSEKELQEAESTFALEKSKKEAEKEERAKLAKEVQDAYVKAEEAHKAADEKLREFCKKYGAYHATLSKPMTSMYDLWDFFFNF